MRVGIVLPIACSGVMTGIDLAEWRSSVVRNLLGEHSRRGQPSWSV